VLFGLDYPGGVWALDFEFIALPGERPSPVAMVARELETGRLIRLFQGDFPRHPPFPIDETALFVGYFSSAEWGCFLSLGWPLPARILDLFAEFRCQTNGLALAAGQGLLGALAHHHLPGITSDEKKAGRNLVLRGAPWSDHERDEVLDYCQSDVDALGPLLERMLPAITTTPKGLGQALLRGRYTRAVAVIERAGVPIDTEALGTIREAWPTIKDSLVRSVDQAYHVYEGTTFREGWFRAWLLEHHVAWPRTDTGRLRLDRETFRDMSRLHPELQPLHELRIALSELRLEKLAVGRDGRNRVLLSPYGATTGRNTPSSAKFVFGPSAWLRSLIRPQPGRALAHIDYHAQEVAIAAHLSGDRALLEAVKSGDPYLAFAVRAGLCPPDATKESHRSIRDTCKTCVLGVNYGMGAATLASRAGVSELDAKHLLRAMAGTFPRFTEWSEEIVDFGNLAGRLATVFGWRVRVDNSTRPTTLRNFPMQANAAEMLRIACCLATEHGVEVCAPIHDALLIESAEEDIDQAVALTVGAMETASAAVLDGLRVSTDVTITRWPDRYRDPRGLVMWERVCRLAGVEGV
jgi:hypothetical protein